VSLKLLVDKPNGRKKTFPSSLSFPTKIKTKYWPTAGSLSTTTLKMILTVVKKKGDFVETKLFSARMFQKYNLQLTYSHDNKKERLV